VIEGAGERDGRAAGRCRGSAGAPQMVGGMEGEGGGGAAAWMQVVLGARGRWDGCSAAWAEVGHAGDSRARSAACASGVVLS
jgi:hypothetical protein